MRSSLLKISHHQISSSCLLQISLITTPPPPPSPPPPPPPPPPPHIPLSFTNIPNHHSLLPPMNSFVNRSIGISLQLRSRNWKNKFYKFNFSLREEVIGFDWKANTHFNAGRCLPIKFISSLEYFFGFKNIH